VHKFRPRSRLRGRARATLSPNRQITAGKPPATPRNSAGPSLPHSPASFRTRFPPMENPDEAPENLESVAPTYFSPLAATSAERPEVVKRRRTMVHAAAVALVHAHPFSRRQPIPRDSQHVLRLARSFQPVHDDQRQRTCSAPSAVTVGIERERPVPPRSVAVPQAAA